MGQVAAEIGEPTGGENGRKTENGDGSNFQPAASLRADGPKVPDSTSRRTRRGPGAAAADTNRINNVSADANSGVTPNDQPTENPAASNTNAAEATTGTGDSDETAAATKEIEPSLISAKSGLEVDFILGDAEAAIEIKGSSLVDSRELKSLRAFKDEFKVKQALLVCNEKSPRLSDGSIRILPPEDFLEELWAGKAIR